MKKIIYSTLVLLFSILAVQAQSKSEIKADKYYERYSYDKAIKRYTDLDSMGVESLRKLAISYKNRNMYPEAEESYAKFINDDKASFEDHFNYVLMLKSNAKYDEAEKWIEKLIAENKGNEKLQSFLSSTRALDSLLINDEHFVIKNLDFNNKADDFGATYYDKDRMVFTSTRKSYRIISRIYNWTQEPFFDLLMSETEDAEFLKPKVFNKKLKKKWHEGPASFAKSGRLMAYTQNNYKAKSKDDVVKLQIMFAEYKKHEWQEPDTFFLNNPEYSVGHPSFSSRGDVMFFVSDMPGGYGGTDIYLVTRIGKDKWSEPLNLGEKVNTVGDEMFPYYESRSGLLFFSSNGRNGLGGLDIFVAVKTPKGFDMVENLGAPINSRWDDFSFIIDKKLKNGYFSSNRESGKGGDDIYSYKYSGEFKRYVPADSIDKYTYNLWVLNEETRKAIPKAKVLMDVVPTETNEQGMVSCKFDANVSFDAAVTATGYVGLTHHVDIKHSQKSDVINDTVYLSIDRSRRIVLKDIYYDFNKWDILPEAAVELDKLVDFLKQNPGLKLDLGSHTDVRGSAKFNMKLSVKRANSAVDYIVSRGIERERITAVGYGETNPIYFCGEGIDCTEQDHRQNRRTEIFIQDYGKGKMVIQKKGRK